jgi:hypothetical protein
VVARSSIAVLSCWLRLRWFLAKVSACRSRKSQYKLENGQAHVERAVRAGVTVLSPIEEGPPGGIGRRTWRLSDGFLLKWARNEVSGWCGALVFGR